MLKEFREFALRGNVVDMAIGIVIGGAFTPVVASLVDDLLLPPIGLLLGDTDFTNLFVTLAAGDPAGPYATLADAQAAGAVVLAYGRFLTFVFSFLVVAWAVFLVVRAMNRLRRREQGIADDAPTTKPCPYCATTIPLAATRCPQCTSELEGAAAAGTR
jgi:large conductance mechanosensitive channel